MQKSQRNLTTGSHLFKETFSEKPPTKNPNSMVLHLQKSKQYGTPLDSLKQQTVEIWNEWNSENNSKTPREGK